MITTTIIIIH